MPRRDDDRSLYRRWVAQRDARAFDDLARRHADLVLDVSMRVFGDRATAEDAVQEALLRLAGDGTDRPAEVGVRAWLARIALCAARNARACDRARTDREREVGARRKEAAVRADDVAVREEVRAALARVDPEDAAVLAMRYLHGFEYAEVAHVLDVAEPTARVRVHRALDAVREHTRARGDGEIGGALGALSVATFAPSRLADVLDAVHRAAPPPVAPPVGAGPLHALLSPGFAAVAAVVVAVGVGVVAVAPRIGRDPAPRGTETARVADAVAPAFEPASDGAHGAGRLSSSGEPTAEVVLTGRAPRVTPQRAVDAPPPDLPLWTLRLTVLGRDEPLPIDWVQTKSRREFSTPEREVRLSLARGERAVIGTSDPAAAVGSVSVMAGASPETPLVAVVPGAGDPRLERLSIRAVDAKSGRVLRDAFLDTTERGPWIARVQAAQPKDRRDVGGILPYPRPARESLPLDPEVLGASGYLPRRLSGGLPAGLPSSSWERWAETGVLDIPLEPEPAKWTAVRLHVGRDPRRPEVPTLAIVRLADDPDFRMPVRADEGDLEFRAPPSFLLDEFSGAVLVATHSIGEKRRNALPPSRRKPLVVTIDGLSPADAVVAEVLLSQVRLPSGDAVADPLAGRAVLLPRDASKRFELEADPDTPPTLRFWILGNPEGRLLRPDPGWKKPIFVRWNAMDVAPPDPATR